MQIHHDARRNGCGVAVRGKGAATTQPRWSVSSGRSAPSRAERADVVTAFRKGLAEAGFVEGQNVALEFRWADGNYERLAGLAAELGMAYDAAQRRVGSSHHRPCAPRARHPRREDFLAESCFQRISRAVAVNQRRKQKALRHALAAVRRHRAKSRADTAVIA